MQAHEARHRNAAHMVDGMSTHLSVYPSPTLADIPESVLVSRLLQRIETLLDGRAVALALHDPLYGDTVFARTTGIWQSRHGTRLPAGIGISGYVISQGTHYVCNPHQHHTRFAWPNAAKGIRMVVGLPIKTPHNATIGALLFGGAGEIDACTERILATFADMIGGILNSLAVAESASCALECSVQGCESRLSILSYMLALRDQATDVHSQQTTTIAMRLARRLGMPESELASVRLGALLHDLGKLIIPDRILHKPGPLNDEEWLEMRQHPVYAVQMLKFLPCLGAALDIPFAHHEHWDGTGYPRGLRGEAIPLAARIFAVIDVWDALRSDRPYRRALPEAHVRVHLRQRAGSHFDPRVVNAFLDMLAEEDRQRNWMKDTTYPLHTWALQGA